MTLYVTLCHPHPQQTMEDSSMSESVGNGISQHAEFIFDGSSSSRGVPCDHLRTSVPKFMSRSMSRFMSCCMSRGRPAVTLGVTLCHAHPQHTIEDSSMSAIVGNGVFQHAEFIFDGFSISRDVPCDHLENRFQNSCHAYNGILKVALRPWRLTCIK